MDTRFNEIQQIVLDARTAASELSALEVLTTEEQSVLDASSTSKVSQWRLWIYIFSFAIWLMEKVTIQNSKNTKEQNTDNFKTTILGYRDGLPLVFINGTWDYDLTGIVNPDQYLIIKNTAILQPMAGGLVVKVTGENGPITNDQTERFKIYIMKKKVPGIPVKLINIEADLIQADITVYANAEIIDLPTGKLLNTPGNIYPVLDAIEDYLLKLEFNGAFVKNKFTATIEAATGIYLIQVNSMTWKYAAFPFQEFGALKIPESGHFKILPENLTINYISDAVVYN